MEIDLGPLVYVEVGVDVLRPCSYTLGSVSASCCDEDWGDMSTLQCDVYKALNGFKRGSINYSQSMYSDGYIAHPKVCKRG